jgi:type VI secretion system protein ImpM
MAPSIAGWYGKIPSLGDFASRRLPPSFIDPWDAWLQRGLAFSREALAERWLDVYLNGPVWHFALLPGVGGSDGWIGALMPSVDRVGRHFPLTFALQRPTAADVLAAPAHARDWFAALGAIALACLDIHCQPEHLEARLADLPYPDRPVHAASAGERLATWWPGAANTPLLLYPPTPGAIADVLADAGMARLAEDGANVSLWWHEATAQTCARLMLFRGLPARGDFVLLLDDPDVAEPDADSA